MAGDRARLDNQLNRSVKILQEKKRIEDAARSVSPHVYDIDDADIIVVGCGGDGGENQKKVAKLMKEIAKKNPNQKKVVVCTGDNYYDAGVKAFDDPVFKTHFYDIYKDIGLPWFVILGNHDYNFHKLSGLREKGTEVALRQVQHSYTPTRGKLGKGEVLTTEQKVALYKSDKLDLENLPLWNMPSRYYAIRIRSRNQQIFMLDSNTYPKEYLAFINAKERLSFLEEIQKITTDKQYAAELANDIKQAKEALNPDTNQAAWLAQEMEIAKKQGLTIMFAQHHPLFTPGKRALHSDDNLYLNENEKSELTSKLNIDKGVNYNTLLLEIYKQQGFTMDVVLAAHDHSIYYYNNKLDPGVIGPNPSYPLCQVTSGGGGGKLQPQKIDDEKLGCYVAEHGCVYLSCDEEHNIQFDIYTLDKKLTFNNQSRFPIYKKEKLEVKKLREIVIEACDEYIEKNKQSGNWFSWLSADGGVGLNRANKILTYLQNEPDNLKEVVMKLDEELLKGSITKKHSLESILNAKLLKKCNCTLKELLQDQDRIFTSKEYYNVMEFIFDRYILKDYYKDVKEAYEIDMGSIFKDFIFNKFEKHKHNEISEWNENQDTSELFNEFIKNATVEDIYEGYVKFLNLYGLMVANNYLKCVNDAFSHVKATLLSGPTQSISLTANLENKHAQFSLKIKTIYYYLISKLSPEPLKSFNLSNETENSLREKLTNLIRQSKQETINKIIKDLQNNEDDPNLAVISSQFKSMVYGEQITSNWKENPNTPMVFDKENPNLSESFNILVQKATADEIFQGYEDLRLRHEGLMYANKYLKFVNEAFSRVKTSALENKQQELNNKIEKIYFKMYLHIITIAFPANLIDITDKTTTENLKEELVHLIRNATPEAIVDAKKLLRDEANEVFQKTADIKVPKGEQYYHPYLIHVFNDLVTDTLIEMKKQQQSKVSLSYK